MSSIFAAMRSTGNSLRVIEHALESVQNNVNNAATPGYAKQRLSFESLAFDPLGGSPGGVTARGLESSRDQNAEASVRRQSVGVGYYDAKNSALSGLESMFDVSGETGLAGAMNRLFSAFSNWSVTPGDTTARQNVLQQASALATSFRQIQREAAAEGASAERRIGDRVAELNQLASRVAEFNRRLGPAAANDPGSEAVITATLEELSLIAEVSVLRQGDGRYTVLLGGETPLVIGERAFPIAVSKQPSAAQSLYPNASPPLRILTTEGRDITPSIASGSLGALLEVRNRVIPSLIGGPTEQGDLNRLAEALATQVNDLLSGGLVSEGLPAVPGKPLFTFSGGADAAATLEVDPAVAESDLAAILPGPPKVANGVALALASLAKTPAGLPGGDTVVAFLGGIAARIGEEAAGAARELTFQRQLLSQSKEMRDSFSRVSLDEEAVHLMEFQKSYQANARLISVLNELTAEAINLLR